MLKKIKSLFTRKKVETKQEVNRPVQTRFVPPIRHDQRAVNQNSTNFRGRDDDTINQVALISSADDSDSRLSGHHDSGSSHSSHDYGSSSDSGSSFSSSD